MPRKEDPPTNKPTDDAPEDPVTETPVQLLQNWVKEMTKDAQAGHHDNNEDNSEDNSIDGDGDRSPMSKKTTTHIPMTTTMWRREKLKMTVTI